MSKIKLTKKYTLILSEYFDRDKIISMLKNALRMNVHFGMGLKDSYSVVVRNIEGKAEAYLEIDTISKNGHYFTTITQEIEGKEEYGKETYDKKPDIMDSILSKFNGLITAKKYKTDTYCKLDETLFGINYDANSLDYQLLKLLMSNTQNPTEAMYIAKLIKENKVELTDILNKKRGLVLSFFFVFRF